MALAVGNQCYTSSGGQDLSYQATETTDCGSNPCIVQFTYNVWGGIQRGCYSGSQCYYNSTYGDYCANNASAYAQGPMGVQPDLYVKMPQHDWVNFYCCCSSSNCNFLDPFRLAVNLAVTPPAKTFVNSCFINGQEGYNLIPSVTVPCNVCLSTYNYNTNQIQRWCGDAEMNQCKLGEKVGNYCHNLTSSPTTTVCCCTGNQCNNGVPGVKFPGKVVTPAKPYYDYNDETTDGYYS